MTWPTLNYITCNGGVYISLWSPGKLCPLLDYEIFSHQVSHHGNWYHKNLGRIWYTRNPPPPGGGLVYNKWIVPIDIICNSVFYVHLWYVEYVINDLSITPYTPKSINVDDLIRLELPYLYSKNGSFTKVLETKRWYHWCKKVTESYHINFTIRYMNRFLSE